VCECREMSTDEHLQLLLCQLNSQCVDITTKIATEIIIQVGKQLLNNHALLLSKVYTDFSARLHKEGVESTKVLATVKLIGHFNHTVVTLGLLWYQHRTRARQLVQTSSLTILGTSTRVTSTRGP